MLEVFFGSQSVLRSAIASDTADELCSLVWRIMKKILREDLERLCSVFGTPIGLQVAEERLQ